MTANIAIVIKEKLDAREMSVRDLERQANLKRSVVHNILSGKSKQPNADTLMAIANAFQCSVDELIQGKAAKSSRHIEVEEPNLLQQAPFDKALALDCLQIVTTMLQEQGKEPSASIFWSIVLDTYYYSSLGGSDKQADKKYAEWLIWQKLR